MTGCSAINCSNRDEKGFRLFVFPRNVTRCQQWVHNMRRDNWSPTASSRLCEQHFEESQFENNRADGFRKLKPNALPTLFNVPNPPLKMNPDPRKSLYKLDIRKSVKMNAEAERDPLAIESLSDSTNNIEFVIEDEDGEESRVSIENWKEVLKDELPDDDSQIIVCVNKDSEAESDLQDSDQELSDEWQERVQSPITYGTSKAKSNRKTGSKSERAKENQEASTKSESSGTSGMLKIRSFSSIDRCNFNKSFLSFVGKEEAKKGLNPLNNKAKPLGEVKNVQSDNSKKKPDAAIKAQKVSSPTSEQTLAEVAAAATTPVTSIPMTVIPKPILVSTTPTKAAPNQLFYVLGPDNKPLIFALSPNAIGQNLNAVPLQIATSPANTKGAGSISVTPTSSKNIPNPAAVDVVPNAVAPATNLPVISNVMSLRSSLQKTPVTTSPSEIYVEYSKKKKLEAEKSKDKFNVSSKGTKLVVDGEEIIVIDDEKDEDTENKVNRSRKPAEIMETNICFVPDCTIKRGEKVYLFGVPIDKTLMSLWESCIDRKDKKLRTNDLICAKHFAVEDIVFFTEEGLVSKPKLRKGAVPCVNYHKECCVPNCGRTEGKMFKFPIFDHTNLQLWLYMVRNTALKTLSPNQLLRHRVCSNHFEFNCFEKGELNKTAVPTLCLPDAPMNSERVKTYVTHGAPKLGYNLKCIVRNCPSVYDTDKRVYAFPFNVDRCKQWLNVCERMDLWSKTNIIFKLQRARLGVCQNHFHIQDYDGPIMDRLKLSAVPLTPINSEDFTYPDDNVIIEVSNLEDPLIAETFPGKENYTSTSNNMDNTPRTEWQMSLYCAVLNCVQLYVKDNSKAVCHMFPDPETDSERYQIWMKLVANDALRVVAPKTVRETYMVCEKHFQAFFYSATQKHGQLCDVAVPTLNLLADKKWLFKTTFYQTKVKKYLQEVATYGHPKSNISWTPLQYIDESEGRESCFLETDRLSFPGLGYCLQFDDEAFHGKRKYPYDVYTHSDDSYELLNKIECGEGVKLHTAIIINDSDESERLVLEQLLRKELKGTNGDSSGILENLLKKEDSDDQEMSA